MTNDLRIPDSLSGKFVGSFAYRTIKDRLPVILTRVIDLLFRERNTLTDAEQESTQEVKEVIGRLSKLRNEMQTDKEVLDIVVDGPDREVWNSTRKTYILENSDGEGSFWFKAPWLYVECYMYRRIREAFQLSSTLQWFDPFRDQKETAFKSSLEAVVHLSKHLLEINENNNEISRKENFIKLVHLALWGNKCDLSLSGGEENSQTVSPLKELESLKPKILVNDSEKLWNILWTSNANNPNNVSLHVVLDNAGFELFTDLCLVDYLTETGLIAHARFYVKAMPWFVSDVVTHDFHWLLETLKSSDSVNLSKLGSKWSSYIQSARWTIIDEPFWTLPQDFSQMKSMDPKLYSQLETADLIIFKGDLNYRKLTGDLAWEHCTDFKFALRGFEPAPLCTLRTVKAEVLVGLEEGTSQHISSEYPNWLESGDFGVIQCNI